MIDLLSKNDIFIRYQDFRDLIFIDKNQRIDITLHISSELTKNLTVKDQPETDTYEISTDIKIEIN